MSELFSEWSLMNEALKVEEEEENDKKIRENSLRFNSHNDDRRQIGELTGETRQQQQQHPLQSKEEKRIEEGEFFNTTSSSFSFSSSSSSSFSSAGVIGSGRRLLDVYGDSLRFVNSLLNQVRFQL